MKRKRGERPTYEIDTEVEQVSQNYYPITSMIGINDKEYYFFQVLQEMENSN